MARELSRKYDGYIPEDESWKFERMLHPVRERRWPEIFVNDHPHPEHAGCVPAPPHIVDRFMQVYGDMAKDDEARIYFNQWTKRYEIYNRGLSKTGCQVWYMAVRFNEKPQREPQILPRDLEEVSDYDGRYDTNIGNYGDYYEPQIGDFAYMRKWGDRKRQEDERQWGQNYTRSEKDPLARAVTKRLEDYEEDFRDYYFNAAVHESNEAHGSMQGYHVVPGTSLEHVEAERVKEQYVIEEVKDKDGFVLYTRRSKKYVLEKIPATRFLNSDGRFVTIRGTLAAESQVSGEKWEDFIARYAPDVLEVGEDKEKAKGKELVKVP